MCGCACRSEYLALAARRLEDSLHPGNPGNPAMLERKRNRSFFHPSLQQAISKADSLLLSPDMLPPRSLRAFRQRGGDPLNTDPLLRVLTDRAAEAGFAKSTGLPRLLKVLPSDACVMALCAYFTNQTRRDQDWRTDPGYSRLEPVGPLEIGWRPYMDPYQAPKHIDPGKIQPDVDMAKVEALGMAHPPVLTSDVLGVIDGEVESLMSKASGWQSVHSLCYENPGVAVMVHCLDVFFHDDVRIQRHSSLPPDPAQDDACYIIQLSN